MKEEVKKITSNPLGLVVGAGVGFMVAVKAIKTEKMWIKVVSAIVGGVAGAMIQSKIKAKASQPTAKIVATPAK